MSRLWRPSLVTARNEEEALEKAGLTRRRALLGLLAAAPAAALAARPEEAEASASFTGGTGLQLTATVCNEPPAFSFRMKSSSTSPANQVILSAHGNSNSGPGWTLSYSGASSKLGFGGKVPAGYYVNVNGASKIVNNGVWHPVAVNIGYGSGSANTLYVDGVQDGTVNAGGNWTGNNQGMRVARDIDAFWGSSVCEVADLAIYNAQLTTAEIAALALDISPLRVAPRKLVGYLPLIRSTQDLMGRIAVTNVSTGPTVTDHPRRIG